MIKGIELYTNQAGDIAVYRDGDDFILYHLCDNKPVEVYKINFDDFINEKQDDIYYDFSSDYPEYVPNDEVYFEDIVEGHWDYVTEKAEEYITSEKEINHIIGYILSKLLGVPMDSQLPF
ncbi:MAG: hypothetical protein J6Y28_07940 [Acholeplasmatales bacterium]|nr:hypothetical protein [Acholeplasmatales bacterium]